MAADYSECMHEEANSITKSSENSQARWCEDATSTRCRRECDVERNQQFPLEISGILPSLDNDSSGADLISNSSDA
jgi:hypothetical protein